MTLQSKSVLTDAMIKYFGAKLADSRQSIKTDIVDQKIIGAIASRTNISKSRFAVSLKANKTHNNILHIISKAANGTLSINTLFPFQDIKLNRRGTGFNTVNTYVLTSASSGEYERTVAGNQEAPKALAFGNGNIAALSRLFASENLNGADIRGDYTLSHVPTNIDTWTKDYFEQLGGKNASVGRAINMITLHFWGELQDALKNEMKTEVDKQEIYQNTWNKYQAALNLWVQKGYLDISTVLYAKPNGIKPDVAAYFGTTSVLDELNIQKIMGTAEGRTSVSPSMNEGVFNAIILDDKEDEHGKHHFGIFKLASVSTDNLEVLDDEEEISKTSEICTRAVQIFDGAGKALKARIRVVDEVYGTNKPIKHSRSFYNLAVGSVVHVQGNISFRLLKENSQAITVELEAEEVMSSTSNNNMITGDLVSESDLDELDLSSLTLDSDLLTTNQSIVDQSQEQNPVLASDTQSDDDMNS